LITLTSLIIKKYRRFVKNESAEKETRKKKKSLNCCETGAQTVAGGGQTAPVDADPAAAEADARQSAPPYKTADCLRADAEVCCDLPDGEQLVH